LCPYSALAQKVYRMSSANLDKFVFTGTPTSKDERKVLREADFIHVTGLHTFGVNESLIGENLSPEWYGKWNAMGNVCVIVTEGGEVWMRTSRLLDQVHSVLDDFCPNGSGGFVDCANGEQIATRSLLDRLRDPSFGLVVPAGSC